MDAVDLKSEIERPGKIAFGARRNGPATLTWTHSTLLRGDSTPDEKRKAEVDRIETKITELGGEITELGGEVPAGNRWRAALTADGCKSPACVCGIGGGEGVLPDGALAALQHCSASRGGRPKDAERERLRTTLHANGLQR